MIVRYATAARHSPSPRPPRPPAPRSHHAAQLSHTHLLKLLQYVSLYPLQPSDPKTISIAKMAQQQQYSLPATVTRELHARDPSCTVPASTIAHILCSVLDYLYLRNDRHKVCLCLGLALQQHHLPFQLGVLIRRS